MTKYVMDGHIRFWGMSIEAEDEAEAVREFTASVNDWMGNELSRDWTRRRMEITGIEEWEPGLWCADVLITILGMVYEAESIEQAQIDAEDDLERCMDEWVPCDPDSTSQWADPVEGARWHPTTVPGRQSPPRASARNSSTPAGPCPGRSGMPSRNT